MGDERGKGPNTPGNEGRVERNPSRGYENNPGNPVREQQQKTQKGVNDALNKKK